MGREGEVRQEEEEVGVQHHEIGWVENRDPGWCQCSHPWPLCCACWAAGQSLRRQKLLR